MIPLAPLPYGYADLQPAMSGEQLRFHHDVHYRRYVDRANDLTGGRYASAQEAVEDAVRREDRQLYDQAAQVVNHELFFESMSPATKDEVVVIGEALRRTWAEAATSVFGSGWLWLVRSPDESAEVQVMTSSNAVIPRDALDLGDVLLVMDVWEHAYYLDYPADRAGFAAVWLEQLANWPLFTGRLNAPRLH